MLRIAPLVAIAALVAVGGSAGATVPPGALAYVTDGVVHVVGPDGRDTRVFEGNQIAWSADGARLAFVRPGSSSGLDLYVGRADGTAVRMLVGDPGDELHPAWSPDGERIAFAQLDPGGDWRSARLAVVDVATGRRSLLASDMYASSPPVWMGDEIVYAAWRPSGAGPTLVFNSDLVAVRVDATHARRLLTDTGPDDHGPVIESDPVLAPDGSRIAYIRTRSNPNYPGELWVMGTDGGGQRRLTDRALPGVSWAPDSLRIAFAVDPAQGCSRACDWPQPLDVVSILAGTIRTLSSTTLEARPAWSPDGSKIAFLSARDGGTELYELNTAGSPCETRLTRSHVVNEAAWQPQGSSGRPLHCVDLHVGSLDTGIWDPLALGTPAAYRLPIRNIGDQPARDVRVTTTFDSFLQPRAAAIPGGACSVGRRQAVCRLGRLAPGAERTAIVTVASSPAVARVVGRSLDFVVNSHGAFTVSTRGESNVGDNHASFAQLIYACTSLGTEKSETLAGTGGPDRICALDGDDVVYGRGGDDIINAGLGDDTIYGGSGRDVIRGRGGDDRIYAADGEEDVISCGTGVDDVQADRLDRVSTECEAVERVSVAR